MQNAFTPARPVSFVQRTLPGFELRAGATVVLGKDSPRTRKLPGDLIGCIGGTYAKVLSVSLYGEDYRVTVDHKGKRMAFVVHPTWPVVVRAKKSDPVDHTPLGMAVALGLPGAAELAVGTSYADPAKYDYASAGTVSPTHV